MTRHYNMSIVERANRILNTKQGDFLSDELQGPIATIEVNKPTTRLIKVVSSSTSSSTVTQFTTAAEKDTYLTGIFIAIIKDSTCDAADGVFQINAFVDGTPLTPIAAIQLLNLAAQEVEVFIDFHNPIKLDRNTIVQAASPTFTVGRFRRSTSYYGYTEEVTKT